MSDAQVPCGDCRLCCYGEAVFVMPERGDSLEGLTVVREFNPLTKRMGWRIPHRPDGACVHLGPAGCTVYDRRPAICRTFSCVALAQMPAAKRRLYIERTGGGAKELMARGVELIRSGAK